MQNEFKAILLLTHAVDLDNAQEQYLNFEKAARVHFPAHTIYWVFTYGERKQILPGQEQFFSFTDAITQLYSQGCAQALVQPLYVVPGQEFKQLQQEVACFKKRNKGFEISLGAPLLSDAAAVRLFVQKLASEQEGTRPASQTILSRQATFSNGATLYVGHGSNDPDAERIYNLLQQELQGWDKRFFFTSLLSKFGISAIIKQLQQNNYSAVQLIPLMTNPGKKSLAEIAGPGDSLSSKLADLGISCTAHLHGLIENKNAQTLWLAHLQKAHQKINPTQTQ